MLQNLLRQATNHKNKGQNAEDNTITMENVKLKQIETVISSKNSTAEPYHNSTQATQTQHYGIIHQNALPPQIAIIGSAQAAQVGANRIFLASQPSTSGDGSTKIINTPASQSQITTLTAIPNAAIIMDNNSGVRGQPDGKVSAQCLKLDKMLFDTDKQRILYTTNFKNSRGAHLLQHLNASKVVNIVPLHSSSQGGPTAATVLRTRASGDSIIQRVATLTNAQNIRPSNNGGSKVVGMVSATVSDPKMLQASNDTGINTSTR